MTREQELKARHEDLSTRIEALVDTAKPVREQLGNIDRQLSKLRAEREAVYQELKKASETPRCSDHAVIRYLERLHGFSFEHVRSQLLTPTVVAAMDAGVGSVKVNGATLKISGRTITTVLDA